MEDKIKGTEEFNNLPLSDVVGRSSQDFFNYMKNFAEESFKSKGALQSTLFGLGLSGDIYAVNIGEMPDNPMERIMHFGAIGELMANKSKDIVSFGVASEGYTNKAITVGRKGKTKIIPAEIVILYVMDCFQNACSYAAYIIRDKDKKFSHIDGTDWRLKKSNETGWISQSDKQDIPRSPIVDIASLSYARKVEEMNKKGQEGKQEKNEQKETIHPSGDSAVAGSEQK